MKYLIFIITFLLSSFAFTQTQWVVFDSINAPLQTNLIKGIKTDSYGNVWFGTNNGLYKYDGLFWKNYNTNNSQIPYNQINNFFLDRNDNIWFPISELPYPYFVKFDGANWEIIDSNQTCFANSHIFAIDGYETKWVYYYNGLYDGLIYRYDGFSCIEYDQNDIGVNTTDIVGFEIDINDDFFFLAQAYEFGEKPGIARTTSTGWLVNTFYGYNFGFGIDFTLDINNSYIWLSYALSNPPYNFVKIDYDSLQVIDAYEYPDINPNGPEFGHELVSDLNGNIWQDFIFDDGGQLIGWGLLCFLSSSEEWLLFDENNSQLPSNEINEIAVDINNNKWITTDKGLAVYNEIGVVLPEQLTLIDTLNYGDVNIGESSSEELTIYNPTGNNLIIDSLNFTNYVFSSNANLPIDITANDSATIIINFQPVTVENYLSRLTLYTNNGMYAQVVAGVGKSPSGVFIEEPLFSFSLSQNYPNPFNPNTSIKYQIPEISFVTIKVYDVLGNEIATVVNEEKPAGSYEVEFDANELASGIYFYKIQAGSFVETKKMVLMK